MPPRGTKKTITKGERVATLTARVQYQRSQLRQPTHANIVDRVSQPTYSQWAVGQMNMDQLNTVYDKAQNITRSDRVADGIADHLIPELGQMQQQKEQIEAAMKAIREGFALGFASTYATDRGFEADDFYTMMETRIKELNDLRVQQQIAAAAAEATAQAQAQAQAAQAQNQAPANADAQMGS